MVRILRQDASMLRQLLPSELGGRLHVGDEFLTERLHRLAVQGVLPTLGRLLELPCSNSPARTPLLELPCAESPPLGATLREQRHQIRPQASGLAAQRLTLGEGRGHGGEETDDALRPRVLVGRRPPPVPPPQENTGYSLERMVVRPSGRCISRLKRRAFSPPVCNGLVRVFGRAFVSSSQCGAPGGV